MSKNEIATIDHVFLESVSDVLLQARKNAKTAVNLTMVYAYYEIGRIIVEEEQRGERRAAYGQQLLKGLSDYLTQNFGKGFSVGNLKIFVNFIRFILRIKLAKQCLANSRIFHRLTREENFILVGHIT